MAVRRLLAGTTLVLRNSTKTRSISSSNASFHPPGPFHCPVLLAAATLRIGAWIPGGAGYSPGAVYTEETTPRNSLSARASGAKLFLGGAAGRAREAPVVPKLVPEGSVPDLVKGALVGGDEDIAE